MRRLSGLLSFLLLATVLFALPSAATEGEEEPSPPTEEGAEQQATVDVEPAVPVTTPDAAEATPDWTYRYLIPTGIVIAAVIVLITTIQYFTAVVRKRYRIIDE